MNATDDNKGQISSLELVNGLRSINYEMLYVLNRINLYFPPFRSQNFGYYQIKNRTKNLGTRVTVHFFLPQAAQPVLTATSKIHWKPETLYKLDLA